MRMWLVYTGSDATARREGGETFLPAKLYGDREVAVREAEGRQPWPHDLTLPEGKVLVDQRRLVRALECYNPAGDRFYCCWPDCGWGGPGTLFDKGERQPHSGDCPGRESVP